MDLLHNSYFKGSLAVGALLGPGRGKLRFYVLFLFTPSSSLKYTTLVFYTDIKNNSHVCFGIKQLFMHIQENKTGPCLLLSFILT